MTDQQFKVGYALRRANCFGCRNKIEKGLLRISYVENLVNYIIKQGQYEKKFHLDCFKYLHKQIENVKIEDINGYDVLEPDDQKILAIQIQNLKTMSKEEQGLIEDMEIKNEGNKIKKQKKTKQQNQNQQHSKARIVTTRKNLKLRWEQNYKKKQDLNICDQNIIQISDDDDVDNDNDDDNSNHKKKTKQFISLKKKRIYAKKIDYNYKLYDELIQIQKQFTDSDGGSDDEYDQNSISQSEVKDDIKSEVESEIKSEVKDEIKSEVKAEIKSKVKYKIKPMGYLEREWETYKQNIKILQTSTALVLKELLRYNDQNQSGTKYELLERVADCMTLGAIPKCPFCKAGKLLYDKQTAIYTCPGFYDESELIQCNMVFNKIAIRRLQWKQL